MYTIKEDINENLNKIVVMVRGKLAQENILDDIQSNRDSIP